MNSKRRQVICGGAALAIAAIGFGWARTQFASAGTPLLALGGNLPSLGSATGWLNSSPIASGSLPGKVVLIQFWTYTCVNWLRTLPHVRAWAARYGGSGLVVIGVHTPEFSFEHSVDNVQRAATAMQVNYPVVIDNDHAIWDAFSNNYWPALYVADASGRIRYRHFGEGAYDESERVVQQLLAESGADGIDPELVTVDPRGAEVAADLDNLKSPETYLGPARTSNFASPGGLGSGSPRTYVAPAQLKLNQWALGSNWTADGEAVVLNEPHGRIAYQFRARDLNLVIGSPGTGASSGFRVLLDGQAPGTAHGIDVDEHGNGALAEQRLYQLVRQPPPVTERRFEIEFFDSNAAAYDFTFG
jgi:thiol-disulfide isomerase/thioredoxin